MPSSAAVTYTMTPGCECGCELNQSSGYIVASSSARRCAALPRVWSVRVADGLAIRLTLIRAGAYGTVRVHDGQSSLSNLLLQLDPATSLELPRPLTSAGSTLRVEYVPPPPADQRPVDDAAFVARFHAVSE